MVANRLSCEDEKQSLNYLESISVLLGESKVIESSKNIRKNILRLAYKAGNKGAHIAPSLSMVEIISVLFCQIMNHNKDKFVLSKGHGGLCYYCGMAEAGIITEEQLNTFEDNGGFFPGQPSRDSKNGVVFSSGSLGMGLSYSAGLAWAAKKRGLDDVIYTLIGDGELNEGSNWEAAMLIPYQGLNNVVAIVDNNGMQSDGFSKDILQMDLASAWRAFGWDVIECDGHNEKQLLEAFEKKTEKPKVIIAKTVKGKGVSFMENDRTWHHNHMTEEQYNKAIKEVEEKYGI